jgi:hypothetical protein
LPSSMATPLDPLRWLAPPQRAPEPQTPTAARRRLDLLDADAARARQEAAAARACQEASKLAARLATLRASTMAMLRRNAEALALDEERHCHKAVLAAEVNDGRHREAAARAAEALALDEERHCHEAVLAAEANDNDYDENDGDDDDNDGNDDDGDDDGNDEYDNNKVEYNDEYDDDKYDEYDDDYDDNTYDNDNDYNYDDDDDDNDEEDEYEGITGQFFAHIDATMAKIQAMDNGVENRAAEREKALADEANKQERAAT